MRTISKIAFSNDKRNRTRSVLIMTAICLTTMLLVIISTIGNGLILLQKDQAASSYGSNYGLFIAADGTQLKEVERRAEISDMLLVNLLYLTLRMEVKPIPIRERLQDPL